MDSSFLGLASRTSALLNVWNKYLAASRMNREKVMKGDCSSTVASPKKALADITNFQYPCSKLSNQREGHQNASFVPKDYLALAKENAMLKKFMTELQAGKLKMELEKLRKQNSDLARANHVLLTELNSCKDRLKELHHELGCKNGVVMAMKQELEEKRNTVTSAFEVAASYKEEGTKRRNPCKTSQTNNVHDKLCSSKRKKLFKPQSLPAAHVCAHDEVESSKKRARQEQYTGYKSESIPVLYVAAVTEENEERSNVPSSNSPTFFKECETSKVCGAKKRKVSKPLLVEPTASEQVDAHEKVGNKRRMRRQSAFRKSVRGPAAIVSEEYEERCETSIVDTVDDKLCNVKKKRLSNPLPLMATSRESSHSQEKVRNRRCSRRLSEGFKLESDPAVSSAFVLESDGERFNGSNVSSQKSLASGHQEENTEEITTAAKLDSQESRRSIIGRPLRRAAEKVESYKEISLKVKMRRAE